MAATSAKFRVARKRARPLAIARDHPDQQGSMQPTVPIPDLAAPLRGLSNSSATRYRPGSPPLRSFASRGSVRDRLRSSATTRPSRAQCTPPFHFPTAQHSRAALAIRQRHNCDRHGPTYDTSHPAEACALTCAASPPRILRYRALKPLLTHSILSTLSSLGRFAHFAHFAHFDFPPRIPQRITDRGDHFCEVSRPAEACATISDHPDQQSSIQPTVPIPDLAAPASAKFRVPRKRAQPFATTCDHLTQQGSV
ncbi:hypothetical protein EDB84DRAFT_1640994 [Lactarius hengduanensis]|nr:hypothetical protein EDB84DRAFT_1640994 [Lactarius hengduanensis]